MLKISETIIGIVFITISGLSAALRCSGRCSGISDLWSDKRESSLSYCPQHFVSLHFVSLWLYG